MASGSWKDHVVHVWEVETGKLHQTLKDHKNSGLVSVVFSPDGRLLASGGRDTVYLWEVETGKLQQTLKGHGGAFWGDLFSFSPDGRLLAVGRGYGTIDLWEVETGKLQQTLTSHKGASWSAASSLSSDGRLLALSDSENAVYLWEVETGKLKWTRKGHKGETEIWSAAFSFSPDSRLLAAGSYANTVYLWEVESGKLKRTLNHEGGVSRVAFSPDSQLLASSNGGDTHLWKVETGELYQTLKGEVVAFSPDGSRMALISGNEDGTVHLSPVETDGRGSVINTSVLAIAADPKGRWIATAHHGGTVRVWEVATGKLWRSFRDHGLTLITCLTFSPNGDGVVVWDDNHHVRSWTIEDGTARSKLPLKRPKQCPAPLNTRYSIPKANLSFWPQLTLMRRTMWDVIRGRFRFAGVKMFIDRTPSYEVTYPSTIVIVSTQPEWPLLLIELALLGPILLLWIGRAAARSVHQYQLRQQVFKPVLNTVQQFFERASATTRRAGERSLQVISASGRLQPFTPLPILFAADVPTEEDVNELVQHAMRLQCDRTDWAGILIYSKPPDALARLHMAEVRLRNRFVLIPIPFAEVEQALRDDACVGLLAEYSNRYLPGADLFDDRLAISDALTFFGRTQLLNRLQDELVNLPGIGLFGLRKSGKTSVMLQLSSALRHHPVVRCDLQLYGEKTRYGAALFNAIIEQLSKLVASRQSRRAPRFTPFASAVPAADLTVEFARRIMTLAEALPHTEYTLPILCFLDEVERMLPTKTDSREKVEEFNACFGVLRTLSQNQRVLALLVADVHPDCNRINQWPQEGVASNPVYNFFKEVFLPPFTADDTATMLTDLGRFMGREFDEQTLQAIHRESGGHPYVARQFASLLSSRLSAVDHTPILWSTAQRYIENPFNYSGLLKNYCDESIWSDLQKRQFTAAMAILQVLACKDVLGERITERTMRKKLHDAYTESQWLDALLWLEAVGLVDREETVEGESYACRLPLLSRWLRMHMGAEEIRQWQVR